TTTTSTTTRTSTTSTTVPSVNISGFTPAKGPAETNVTITGTGLTGSTSVQFNGTPAAFKVLNSTHIRATVPAGACPSTAQILVNTPSRPVTSASTFTCAATITGFTPIKGPLGTVVTITGTGFKEGSTGVQFG